MVSEDTMQVAGRKESSVVFPSCAPPQAAGIAWKALPDAAMWMTIEWIPIRFQAFP